MVDTMAQADHRRELAQYVAGLAGLCTEVSGAIAALASNDLTGFEARLDAQRSLCRRLNGISRNPEFLARLEDSGDSVDQADVSALKAELRSKQQELARLNHQYASLLKHSEQTVSLLALLCRSYTQGYGKTDLPCSPGHLSCEV